ncbi:PorT family protein [Hymenobacter sp. BT175]|uniref:outer membrane beta-barrel protein n=1 Tax=Hymenobacter translucens TaxID=2886507 RepID=UPI001D0E91A2|nr:outer membrane beta-barrel protein [Hymenobacter translucens]MCC2547132.1 PorT family protein [Hymenobacter translucens]
MQKTLLVLTLLTARLGYGQHTELSVHLNSGFGSFRGASATERSSIVVSSQPTTGPAVYTYNPYGSEWAMGYGLTGQVQRVGQRQRLVGVQAGYEALQSRVHIRRVFHTMHDGIAATGRTILTNHFLTVHPFYGYRAQLRSVALDLSAGPELAVLLHSREQGQAVTEQGASYGTSRQLESMPLDVRARLNLTAGYRRLSVSLGYSYGLTNYSEAQPGGPGELYYQFFRIGTAYRIAGK